LGVRTLAAARVAIIGHFVVAPTAVPLPREQRRAAAKVAMTNYTHVVTDDGLLMDHIAWLKRERGVPANERFSVWEMNLTSGLLLSSHLRRNGFPVKLINFIDSDNINQRLDEIAAFRPDVIAVSTTFVLSGPHLTSIGQQLRKRFPGAFLVAGGHHVATKVMYLDQAGTAAYMNESGFDGFVVDVQGEDALVRLCQNFPSNLGIVANLVWRSPDGKVTHNLRKAEANDVNDTLIEFDDVRAGEVVHIRTARSCSFKCAFCSYPTIAGALASMDLDNVMATLRKAKAAGVSTIFFIDDTFNVPRGRFERLIDRMIEEDLRIPWYSFLRCQYVDEALVGKMRRSGCAGVFLGVESGSNKILKNMKKGAIINFYHEGVRWLKEAGIIAVGAFIVGFPGETAETVEQTREFIETFGLDFYFIQPFYYLHHTPIHKRAKEFQLTGNALYWSHATMDSFEAQAHINRLFRSIKNSIFVNPDYTLWEIAYLLTKGLSIEEIKSYRRTINELTLRQMDKYGIAESVPDLEPATLRAVGQTTSRASA
jgi:radical SAM superfamily enzyme YgiQ (UPF0313 family)